MKQINEILRTAKELTHKKGIGYYADYLYRYILSRSRWKLSNSWYRLSAAIGGQRNIYCVGDSHVMLFRDVPRFIIYWLGPATAYKLADKESTTNSNRRLMRIAKKVRKEDILLVCFGEIDCRVHVHKQTIENKRNMEDIVGDIMDRYVSVLKQLKLSVLNLCVLGISPAGRNYDGVALGYSRYNLPASEHKKIKGVFNSKLRDACRKNKIPFIDIYSRTLDSAGYMSKKYSGDNIHLNDKAIEIIKDDLNAHFGIGKKLRWYAK
jgi:hypothetical protein